MLTFFCHCDSDHQYTLLYHHSCYIMCVQGMSAPCLNKFYYRLPFVFPVCVLYLQQSSYVLILLLAYKIFCLGTTPMFEQIPLPFTFRFSCVCFILLYLQQSSYVLILLLAYIECFVLEPHPKIFSDLVLRRSHSAPVDTTTQ